MPPSWGHITEHRVLMGAGGAAEASVSVWRHGSSEDTAGTGYGVEFVRVI